MGWYSTHIASDEKRGRARLRGVGCHPRNLPVLCPDGEARRLHPNSGNRAWDEDLHEDRGQGQVVAIQRSEEEEGQSLVLRTHLPSDRPKIHRPFGDTWTDP